MIATFTASLLGTLLAIAFCLWLGRRGAKKQRKICAFCLFECYTDKEMCEHIIGCQRHPLGVQIRWLEEELKRVKF